MESTENMTQLLTEEQKTTHSAKPKKDIPANSNFPNWNHLPLELWITIFGYLFSEKPNLLKVSKFFKSISNTNPYIQENLREKATKSDKLKDIQKQYLSSNRVKRQIANRALTIYQAIENSKQFEKIDFNSSFNSVNLAMTLSYDYPLIETVSLLSQAIQFGCLPKEVRYHWFSHNHIEALKAGIPFEEIQGLISIQVEAILKTGTIQTTEGNNQFIQTLTREDVEGIRLTQTHITALEKKMPFKTIKELTELQVDGLLSGLSEEVVKKPWFSKTHLVAIKQGCYALEEIEGLYEEQVALFFHGISREEILHYFPVYPSSLLFSNYRETLDLLREGVKWKDLREVMDAPSSHYSPSPISKILHKGYKISEIKGLQKYQKSALAWQNCSLAQVKQPGFSLAAAETANSLHIPYEQFIKEIKPHQLYALTAEDSVANKDLTIEQVKQFTTPLHTFAYIIGGLPFDTVVNSTGEQLLQALQNVPNQTVFNTGNISTGAKTEMPSSEPVLFSSQAQMDQKKTYKNVGELETELATFQAEEKSTLEQNKSKRNDRKS